MLIFNNHYKEIALFKGIQSISFTFIFSNIYDSIPLYSVYSIHIKIPF